MFHYDFIIVNLYYQVLAQECTQNILGLHSNKQLSPVSRYVKGLLINIIVQVVNT